MKRFFATLALFIFVLLPLRAQTKADEEAVHKLPQAFCDAWAKHDGHELAKLMSEDVDFVTVAAVWLHGRTDFEKFHTRLLSGRFSEALLRPLEIQVRFLRLDLAVIHRSWTVQGDNSRPARVRTEHTLRFRSMGSSRRSSKSTLVFDFRNSGSCMPISPNPVSTDKRARLDWFGQPPRGWQHGS